MTEFNLSEKRNITNILLTSFPPQETYCYKEEDIKEFIRLLKEKIKKREVFKVVNGNLDKQRIEDFKEGEDAGKIAEKNLVLEIIEELAGEKLK